MSWPQAAIAQAPGCAFTQARKSCTLFNPQEKESLRMTELSLAAQKVMDAYHTAPIVGVFPQDADALGVAAALRAAADQVVPDDGVASSIERIVEKRIRAELVAIAAELEGDQSTRENSLRMPSSTSATTTDAT
jgi:hypothetical protein